MGIYDQFAGNNFQGFPKLTAHLDDWIGQGLPLLLRAHHIEIWTQFLTENPEESIAEIIDTQKDNLNPVGTIAYNEDLFGPELSFATEFQNYNIHLAKYVANLSPNYPILLSNWRDMLCPRYSQHCDIDLGKPKDSDLAYVLGIYVLLLHNSKKRYENNLRVSFLGSSTNKIIYAEVECEIGDIRTLIDKNQYLRVADISDRVVTKWTKHYGGPSSISEIGIITRLIYNLVYTNRR